MPQRRPRKLQRPRNTKKKRPSYFLAGIDLGSNALRAVIARHERGQLHVVKTLREPLRLGEEVFLQRKLSKQKLERAAEAFGRIGQEFRRLGVINVRAVATSALRDSLNSADLIKRVEEAAHIRLQIIDGNEEARLIFSAVGAEIDLRRRSWVLLDVGGGSTEVTVVRNGDLVASRSFDVGTVRFLAQSTSDGACETFRPRVQLAVAQMREFVLTYVNPFELHSVIGTGGNLRRLGKLRRKLFRKTAFQCSRSEVAKILKALEALTPDERISRLGLSPDRADVILPASLLVHEFLLALGLRRIALPRVGLKEGVLLSMVWDPGVRLITHGAS